MGSLPGSADKSTDEVVCKVKKTTPCTLSCGWKLWGFIFQIFLWWFGCVEVCGVSRLWWRDNRNPSEEQNLLNIVQVPVALTSFPNSLKSRLKHVGWYQSCLSAEQDKKIIFLLFWNNYSGFKYFHFQTIEKPDWIRLAVSSTVIKIFSLRLKMKKVKMSLC